MTGEPDNIDRASWARLAANVFAEETMCGRSFDQLIVEQPDDGDDAYCVLQDLITDILHLAHQHGWGAEDLIRCATGNFEEELAEATFEEDEDEPPMFQTQLGDPK